MTIWDLISISTGLIYIIPFVLYLLTGNQRNIIVLFGLTGTLLSSEIIKRFIIGKNSIRPNGALNCNMLCDDGDQSGKPGMPSSHSAVISFFVIYYFKETHNIIIKTILVILLGLVAVARYLKRCHTIYQIGSGIVYGAIGAEITRNIIYRYIKA
jgi:hypothetical protein